MSDDSGSERAGAWTPEEVAALFEAAREARLRARLLVEMSRQAPWRREDGQRRDLRVPAEAERADSTGS